MRSIPGLTIVEPSDPVSCAAFVRLAAQMYGCVYLRLPRKAVPALYTEGQRFEFGKAMLLREGGDVCFVALGSLMVNESLKAAEILAAGGVEASVLDVLSLKPLDATAVLERARETGAIVTAENHQIAGGLGGAVAELLAEARFGGAFARVGIRDEFGEVGTQDYLVRRFGMSAEDLAATARRLISG